MAIQKERETNTFTITGVGSYCAVCDLHAPTSGDFDGARRLRWLRQCRPDDDAFRKEEQPMIPGIKRLRRKWQGQWAVLALLKTPDGAAVEVETDLPEDVAKRFLKAATAMMKRKTVP